jgi:hypothetical protein
MERGRLRYVALTAAATAPALVRCWPRSATQFCTTAGHYSLAQPLREIGRVSRVGRCGRPLAAELLAKRKSPDRRPGLSTDNVQRAAGKYRPLRAYRSKPAIPIKRAP